MVTWKQVGQVLWFCCFSFLCVCFSGFCHNLWFLLFSNMFSSFLGMFQGLDNFCRDSLGCQPTRIGCLFSLFLVHFPCFFQGLPPLVLRTSGEFRLPVILAFL